MGRISDPYNDRLDSGSFQPDPAQQEIVAALDRVARSLDQPRRRFSRKLAPRGLYIHGAVGRGKSMLMDLFFEAAPVVAKRRVHFNAFMLDVQRRLKEARAQQESDPLAHVAAKLAQETRLLCFDEFQVKDVADAMILARLFTALLDAGMVVVATSNVAPNDLYQGGLQRELFMPFISVLKARLDVMRIGDGLDHRLARLSGRPVWFHPDDTDAASEITALFEDFANGEWPMPEVLDISGRSLIVPQAAGRIARFTFDQLCRQPLAAADYLALAKRFTVLVVEHVPVFDPAARNEASRFISLIDQLYDRRAGLVASAATTPDGLYPANGPYGFEFRRTVSRLMEMQSADYLAKIINATP